MRPAERVTRKGLGSVTWQVLPDCYVVSAAERGIQQVRRNGEGLRITVHAAKTAFCLLFALLCAGAGAMDDPLSTDHAAEKSVTFYHTYGYLKDRDWVIPMRLWVHEKPSPAQRGLAKVARTVLGKRAGIADLSQKQAELFLQRSGDFFADNESGEAVRFSFDHDPEQQEFFLQNSDGETTTDLNGLLEGVIKLDRKTAERLIKAQRSHQGWLRFRAVSNDHRGIGFVRLISPAGHSVISDIDDTIKVTEITAGEPTVLMNTFFRDFAAVSCMAEMYRGVGGDVAFHYVSGGPWQMYRPLDDFLFSDPIVFPLGSFHMKSLRTNVFEKGTYEDVWSIIASGSQQATLEQKLSQIGTIMNHFPGRSFVLIGDSGEKDPEVFKQIREDFPGQVREIMIRVVTNGQATGPGRLDNMMLIPSNGNAADSCADFAKAAAQ